MVRKLNTITKWIEDKESIIKQFEDKKMYDFALEERKGLLLLEDIRELMKIYLNEYSEEHLLDSQKFILAIKRCFGIGYDDKKNTFILKGGYEE